MATELFFNIERESPATGSLWLTARGVKDETLFTVSVNHVTSARNRFGTAPESLWSKPGLS